MALTTAAAISICLLASPMTPEIDSIAQQRDLPKQEQSDVTEGDFPAILPQYRYLFRPRSRHVGSEPGYKSKPSTHPKGRSSGNVIYRRMLPYHQER